MALLTPFAPVPSLAGTRCSSTRHVVHRVLGFPHGVRLRGQRQWLWEACGEEASPPTLAAALRMHACMRAGRDSPHGRLILHFGAAGWVVLLKKHLHTPWCVNRSMHDPWALFVQPSLHA